jgi:hypothetical protein
MTKRILALVSLSAAATAALAIPAALAVADDHDGREVVRTGDCSGSADWKLKVDTDDGRLEVEGEVDSNRSGQSWRWKLKDNGKVVASGSDTTSGRSGSFEVERTIPDRSGADRIVFRAKHGSEVCVARVTF